MHIFRLIWAHVSYFNQVCPLSSPLNLNCYVSVFPYNAHQLQKYNQFSDREYTLWVMGGENIKKIELCGTQ